MEFKNYDQVATKLYYYLHGFVKIAKNFLLVARIEDLNNCIVKPSAKYGIGHICFVNNDSKMCVIKIR